MLEKRRLARRGTSRVLVLIVGFMLVLGACGGAASPAPASTSPAASQAAAASPTAAPAITAPPIDTTAPGPNGGVVVRWFVGLGAGGQPQQLQTEAEFVDAYNNVAEGRLHRPRDLQQQRRGEHPQDPDRRGQRAGHHRAGRRRGPEPLPRPAPRPAAAHRQDRLQRRRRRPQARRLLQARRGRRHDRRPVRDLPVVPVLQQGPLRRGRPAVPADQGR